MSNRLDRGQHVEHIDVLVHVNVTRSDRFGHLLRMANLLVEEPDALTARPDLWEPWEGNDPGPPDCLPARQADAPERIGFVTSV